MARARIRPSLLAWAGIVATTLASTEAQAWTFPEHAQITGEAIRAIERDPVRGPVLDAAWAAAGTLLGLRACASPAADAASTDCVPLAALPALASDHSCSPADLLSVVTSKAWTLDVLVTAASAGARLKDASEASRVATRHALNIDLQKSDALYSARARVNGAHFQLARDFTETDFAEPSLVHYLGQALRAGQEPNATALYVNFHAAAIAWARTAARERQTCGLAPRATVQALLEEAFALHFMEDAFASGHVVGTWGGASYRIGTHDFYSGLGVDTRTWNHKYYAAFGDAFLTPADLTMSARGVEASFDEVLDVIAGDVSAGATELFATRANDALDVCTTPAVPDGLEALAASAWIGSAIAYEPVPPSRHPSVPRSRTELGFFFGGSVAAEQSVDIAVRWKDGAFAKARAAIRAGYGFDAITAPRMSNQVFVEAGVVGEQNATGQDLGIAARLQVPWAYVPLDGAVILPVAAARQGSEFWVGWAERAGRGPFGIQRTFFWREQFSAQVSIFTDFSLFAFPAQRRYEISAPVVSLYGALPLNWMVTTDALLDIGLEEILDPAFPSPHTAAYISLSSATRLFP